MIEEELIIIGSGPAAYTAALYSSEHNPLMIEGGIIGSNGPGGQLTTTTYVDNYPGFPNGVEGPVLMDKMREQALAMNLRISSETVVQVHRSSCYEHENSSNAKKKLASNFVVHTENSAYKCTAVIIATGAISRRLFVPGTNDDELWQKGISSCAVCDGFFFMDKTVCVIGGGDTAMEEALYLAGIASKVHLIHRRREFRARKDKLDIVYRSENIDVLVPYKLVSAHGEEALEYVKLQNTEDESFKVLMVDGMFFGIGHDPNTNFLAKEEVNCDEAGYVKCNEDMSTNVVGMYACGDVMDKRYRQAVTAAASGSIAGLSVSKYLKNVKESAERLVKELDKSA